MKSAEITDALIARLEAGKYRTLRVNYANGDMVGHTGNYDAAIDRGRDGRSGAGTAAAGDRRSSAASRMITADHGNADEMYELDKNGKAPR